MVQMCTLRARRKRARLRWFRLWWGWDSPDAAPTPDQWYPVILTKPPSPRRCNAKESSKKLSLCFCQGSLIACEFLLQNAADVNQRDMRGRGPLHHATDLGHTGWEAEQLPLLLINRRSLVQSRVLVERFCRVAGAESGLGVGVLGAVFSWGNFEEVVQFPCRMNKVNLNRYCIFTCVLTVFSWPDTAAWISSPRLLMFSQVCLFLKRGASQTEVDEQGHDPLSIAVQAANADIVTLWVLFTPQRPAV